MTSEDITPPPFMKQCAFGGLNLGFWIFKDVELDEAEISAHCGFGTHFDQDKCVARETPTCSTIDLASAADNVERTKLCMANAGCSLSKAYDVCETASSCHAQAGDDVLLQETRCTSTADCTWDADAGACSVVLPSIDRPMELRRGCDGETVKLSTLCGTGTSFDADTRQCKLLGDVDKQAP
jgi:hypothetical protein